GEGKGAEVAKRDRAMGAPRRRKRDRERPRGAAETAAAIVDGHLRRALAVSRGEAEVRRGLLLAADANRRWQHLARREARPEDAQGGLRRAQASRPRRHRVSRRLSARRAQPGARAKSAEFVVATSAACAGFTR